MSRLAPDLVEGPRIHPDPDPVIPAVQRMARPVLAIPGEEEGIARGGQDLGLPQVPPEEAMENERERGLARPGRLPGRPRVAVAGPAGDPDDRALVDGIELDQGVPLGWRFRGEKARVDLEV
jgi:hypothetical protein